MGWVRWVVDTMGGVYQLARLGALSRGRFGGPYWSWRKHTAFGRGYPASRAQLVWAVLDYGRWMHRMRRL